MSKLAAFIKKNPEIKDKLIEACRLQHNETVDNIVYEIWSFREKEANKHMNTYDAITKLQSIIAPLKKQP